LHPLSGNDGAPHPPLAAVPVARSPLDRNCPGVTSPAAAPQPAAPQPASPQPRCLQPSWPQLPGVTSLAAAPWPQLPGRSSLAAAPWPQPAVVGHLSPAPTPKIVCFVLSCELGGGLVIGSRCGCRCSDRQGLAVELSSAWVAGMPCSRSHTSTRNTTSHCSRAAGDLQQDQRRIVAHRWHIFLQGSPQMIFSALNQGRLRPGHCPMNPICPCSTFSQAAVSQRPPLASPSAAKVSAASAWWVGYRHHKPY
jgi:hypothetical protein